MKLLVVNADDLGYDPEIDRGILEAHERGIITSATAMVDTPFAEEALCRAPRTLGLGLHVVVPPSASHVVAEAELRRQIARFFALRGHPPSHLDSHKHAHAATPVLEAFAVVAAEMAVPVRAIDERMRAVLAARGVTTADRFVGDAERRPAWTRERLLDAIRALEDGLTELMAHPGYPPSHARTSFGAERQVELTALCDGEVRRLLARMGVQLCNYAEVRRRPASPLPGT